jgi:uncharacterized RDD family membrane protein YckC
MEQESNVLHEYNEPTYEFAAVWQRLVNFVIDVVAFYVLMAVIGIITGLVTLAIDPEFRSTSSGGSIQLLFLFMYILIIILYYTLLEGSKGKTLGKLITKTKSIQIDGSPLGYKKAFLRSLCRFIPLEFISVFFGGLMWHDQWTYTMTVKDKA